MGMSIFESPVRFEPAIKLGEAAPVSDECRSCFNEWLVEMFGMKAIVLRTAMRLADRTKE